MISPARQGLVILATFTLQGGGAERFVLTLAKAYQQLGAEVHVVSFKRQVDYALPEGVYYHFLNYQAYRWLPDGPLRHRLFARQLDHYVTRHIGQPALVLSNLYQVDKVMHYSRLPHIVYVLHNTVSIEYGLTTDAPTQQAAQLARLYANHPVAGVSQGVVDDYVRHVEAHPNLHAILNPIDRDAVRQLAQAFTPDLPPGYLVHVGKLKKQKDQASLIRAYAASQRKVPLVLVGTGPEQDACQQLAVDLGVADQVIFAGFQPNPYPYIAHAGGMVLSSRFEGFGLVIGEAQALGVPVISTDCESGPRELLPKHCLVPVGDIPAMTSRLNALMASPSDFASDFQSRLLPHHVAMEYLQLQRVPQATIL